MDKALAQRIIKTRSSLGWSQADLAQASGIAAAQISRYEQGRSQPRPEVLAKISKALSVDFEWLLKGEQQHSPTPDEHENTSVQPRRDKVMIQFSEDEYAWVSELAREHNLSVQEMAQRLLHEALERITDDGEEMPATKITEPAQPLEANTLGDIAKRLADLEAQTKELASRVRAPEPAPDKKKPADN